MAGVNKNPSSTPPDRTLALIKQWADLGTSILAGKTVKCVAYLDPRNAKDVMGWDQTGCCIIFTDGTNAFVQCDDEGNGPGALVIHPKSPEQPETTIPVITLR